ncbi:MAG TPA: rod shape-determining protein MreD [Streptosporangiaceae bacterium]
MRQLAVAVAAVLAALIIQVSFLNSVPFPGDAGPSLVLVVVVVLALLSGPLEGSLIGFAAGLAADIAPPVSHLVGQNALVFCLVGYGCGRLRDVLERSEWLPLAGVAIGAVVGETLYALVGIMFGDPDVTWHAVRQVLPVAVAYDLLLAPFVLYVLVWLGGYRVQTTISGATSLLSGGELVPAGAAALAGVGAAGGAVRDTGSGRGPRLKSSTRRPGAWTGTERRAGQDAGAWVHRPGASKLRLRGGVAGSAASYQQSSPARLLPAVHLRFGQGRKRDGVIGSASGAAGAVARTAFGSLAGRPATGRGGKLKAAAFSGGQSALSADGQARKPQRARLRFSSRGGRSALSPGGQARKPPRARLRLGSRRRGDGLVGGGALRRNAWGTAAPRVRTPGRGAFRTTPVGNGMGGGRSGRFLRRRSRAGSGRGYGAAAPAFRGSSRGRLRRLLPGTGRRSASWRIGR